MDGDRQRPCEGASVHATCVTPRPRWAWRAAVDLAEEEGAALAGECGPRRTAAIWNTARQRSNEATRLPAQLVPSVVAGSDSVQPSVISTDDGFGAGVQPAAAVGEESEHLPSSGRRKSHEDVHPLEPGGRRFSGPSDTEVEAEAEATIEIVGTFRSATPPRDFCAYSLAPTADVRLGLEYDEMPLRIGPRSLLRRSRSAATALQQPRKGWMVSASHCIPPVGSSLSSSSVARKPIQPPAGSPGAANLRGPPEPPSPGGNGRPSAPSCVGLRIAEGPRFVGRRGPMEIGGRVVEAGARGGMPRRLPALGR